MSFLALYPMGILWVWYGYPMVRPRNYPYNEVRYSLCIYFPVPTPPPPPRREDSSRSPTLRFLCCWYWPNIHVRESITRCWRMVFLYHELLPGSWPMSSLWKLSERKRSWTLSYFIVHLRC